ncbi:hypothetical protein BHF71_07740 [Vulcanibacillus modesticaldus]|uniref:Dinitrogenase iron-molybdenum cofactor biosynthesis domain-containing protein n=1 Tax=Vulcanibacillus modesticaldus TaxID=337097 RepID=A0A1D2YVG3_9BACI|nr:NifB/NifX family molybdenum-iron cluster-binding protein [Vulcanibacillus modesticaldus]OEF99710.1 hypothetical protein BHF71_07740 [Vulcanibacillus modesticaldus]
MKIAVATEGHSVSGHFGHSEGFTIFVIEDGKVLEKEFIKSPGHKPGFLPLFLKEKEVDAVIAGNMGNRAQQLFNESDIKVFCGVNGLVDDVIDSYLKGELKEGGCEGHHHHGHDHHHHGHHHHGHHHHHHGHNHEDK